MDAITRKTKLDELKENEFDIIVLDPPAFTKSRRTVQKAYNGYKRINKQAMKVLKNGGYLITCSCSRFMETANFEKMLREAASEAGGSQKTGGSGPEGAGSQDPGRSLPG